MKRTLVVALLACLWLVAPAPAPAADPAFVGVLALAVEDNVAKALGLTDEVKKQLDDLIDKREDEILKSGIDKLPEAEQKERLATFVAESEKQGLALLSKEQQSKLTQIRIARGGLSTLADAVVAESVGLSKPQQSNIEKLLASLKTKLAAGTEEERRIAKAEVERELGKILTKEQRAAWDRLAGIAAGEEVPAVEKVAANADGDAEKPEPKGDEPEAAKPETKKPDGKPEAKPELSKPKPQKNLEDVRLSFNFSYTPYKDVLEWLAKEADLSLIADPMPPGTFNYRDTRKYTVPQAIDLINSVLLTRGYTLVRRDRALFVFNLEDGIPPRFAKQVTPEELDALGEYEIVGCLFSFNKAAPEDVEADVRKIVGPQSSVVVLAKSKQMYVQETAGNLRTIRAIIQGLEGNKEGDKILAIKLKHLTTDEIMTTARPLMGMPEGLNAAPDGSLRIAPVTGGFMVKGKPEAVDKFKELVESLDVESGTDDAPPPEQAQIVVYTISTASPDAVLQVLKTIMAGQPNVRIDKDPVTGSIIAHGTPTQHATMKALIEEMQKDTRNFDVIKLRKLDPELAVATLNKAFGIVEGAPNSSAPRLVADATQMLLIVFGSKQQIELVREAVMKMGEAPAGSDPSSSSERSYTRSIPLTGRSLNAALDQFQAVAPVYFKNEIRVVKSPAASGSGEIPSRIPVPKDLEKRLSRPPANTNSASSKPKSDDDDDRGDRSERDDRSDDRRGDFFRRGFGRGDDDDRRRGDDERRPDRDRSREEDRRSERVKPDRYYYVAWQDPELAPQTDAAKPPAAEKPAAAAEAEPMPKQKSTPGAEIVITVTPNGIVVSSQDLDALDEVERMLQEYVSTDQGKEYTIFYLRYAKADVAADLLTQALGGSSSDDGGGGSLMGDIAGQMLGGGGGMGSLLGGMMGGGGGSSSVSSGPVLLIPDNRLNAILAQGKPGDLDIAESLLKIIDQRASEVPVEVVAKPRFIPVYHTTADEMATTIKQVYANRIAADPNQPRQPSPQELMQALTRGGRGGRGGGGGGGGNDRKSEEQKMTIGVDQKSNSLIVSAPPALFEEIEQMVKDLDIASSEKDEYVHIQKSPLNAALIEQSLKSILGDSVEVTRSGASTTTATARSTQRSNTRTANTQGQQNAQPQMNPQMFIQGMQGRGGGFQGGGGFPGGGFQGGGGGGRGRRGGQ